jgi:cytochrome P450
MPGPVNRFFGDLAWQITSDRLNFLLGNARRYGDEVSYTMAGRQFFLFSHPDAVREVLVTQDDAFNKGLMMRRAQTFLGQGLLTSEGDFHRRQRRIAQPVFHPQRMDSYSPIIVDYSRRAVGRWHDGQSVDIHAEMSHLALEIVAKTLFGAEVEGEVEQIGHDMDLIVRRFTRLFSPLHQIMNHLPLPSNFRLKRSIRRLNQVLDRFIQERRAAGSLAPSDHTDLLTLLLGARDSEGDHGMMSDRQIRDECVTIFAAGHETTANALTFTFLLLARNPAAEAKLHAEVDAVLQGRAATAGDLEHLIYTRAVMSEAMRLYPPVWGIGRQAMRGVKIGKEAVPAEAIVLVSQWVTHRDPRWWPDAEEYKPERWLAPDSNRPRWAYFPFGGGTRSCIGEAFAWTEAVLALATVAQRFRVEIPDPNPPKLLATITLRPKYGLKALVKTRQLAASSAGGRSTRASPA